MFSKSTVELFDSLLANYSLPAGHEKFEQIAQQISVARAELRSYYIMLDAKGDKDAAAEVREDQPPFDQALDPGVDHSLTEPDATPAKPSEESKEKKNVKTDKTQDAEPDKA